MRFCGYNINLFLTKNSSSGASKLFLIPLGVALSVGFLKFIFMIFPLICLTALLCSIPFLFALGKKHLS